VKELNLGSIIFPVMFASGRKERLVVSDLSIMSQERDLSKVSRDWLKGMVKLTISDTAKTCGTISGIERRFSSGGDTLLAKDVFWAKSEAILKSDIEPHYPKRRMPSFLSLKRRAIKI